MWAESMEDQVALHRRVHSNVIQFPRKNGITSDFHKARSRRSAMDQAKTQTLGRVLQTKARQDIRSWENLHDDGSSDIAYTGSVMKK